MTTAPIIGLLIYFTFILVLKYQDLADDKKDYAWMMELKYRQKYISIVHESFEDVDWTRNTFSSNGNKMSDHNNEIRFYACKSIDEAIEKLNDVINNHGK